MEACHAHQLILPTDKRNPCFSLYATEDGESIRVFYGLELLEVVPDNPSHPAFKMMVGRLANAGVHITTLEKVFDVNRKTMRSWGAAILSRDPEQLAHVLLGPAVNVKRSPAIDKYVVRRWAQLRSEGCPNYRASLCTEVESIFEVKLSRETLRQIVNESQGNEASIAEALESNNAIDSSARPAASIPDYVLEESICWESPITTTGDLITEPVETALVKNSKQLVPFPGDSDQSKCSPPNWDPRPGETILCDHVGMLIFASALNTIGKVTTPSEPLLTQWLGSILLGAVNIEQTKYLNWEALGNLLGQTVRYRPAAHLPAMACRAGINLCPGSWYLQPCGLQSNPRRSGHPPGHLGKRLSECQRHSVEHPFRPTPRLRQLWQPLHQPLSQQRTRPAPLSLRIH